MSFPKHGKASGKPTPPIAAAITSFTWLFDSDTSCFASPLSTSSFIYRFVLGSSALVSLSKCWSWWSWANFAFTFYRLKFWSIPPLVPLSEFPCPGVNMSSITCYLSFFELNWSMKNELFSAIILISEAKKSLSETSKIASYSKTYSEWLNSFCSRIKLVTGPEYLHT
jgi:hypothetical protein